LDALLCSEQFLKKKNNFIVTKKSQSREEMQSVYLHSLVPSCLGGKTRRHTRALPIIATKTPGHGENAVCILALVSQFAFLSAFVPWWQNKEAHA
jgi:hypothetical protein